MFALFANYRSLLWLHNVLEIVFFCLCLYLFFYCVIVIFLCLVKHIDVLVALHVLCPSRTGEGHSCHSAVEIGRPYLVFLRSVLWGLEWLSVLSGAYGKFKKGCGSLRICLHDPGVGLAFSDMRHASAVISDAAVTNSRMTTVGHRKIVARRRNVMSKSNSTCGHGGDGGKHKHSSSGTNSREESETYLPLFKGGLKDPASCPYYRVLIGISVLLKLFDFTVLQVWGDLLTSDTLQFACKPNTSCSQAIWLVMKVADYYRTNEMPCILTLLDCKQRFYQCTLLAIFSQNLKD